MKKYILGILIILIIFFGSIFLIHSHGNNTTESTYDLQEIENGKYVIYQSTVSSIPAQNYEIATVCINGNIVQIKGTVEIITSDS